MADANKKYVTKQELSDGSVKEAISLTTETFIDQEFVYRKSHKTLDVNTFNLDKIKGKTLAWNQLVQNGDFSQGTANWYQVGGTVLSASDGILTVDCTNPTQNVIGASTENAVIAYHKYYIAFDVKFSSADFAATPTFYIGSAGLYGITSCYGLDVQRSTAWTHYSAIGTIGSDPYVTTGLRLYDATEQTLPSNFQLRNVQVFDLTLMFGAGKEPSTAAEFESLYPLVYYACNAGELVNNKAKALENVGFNLWDEEWEQGSIDGNGNNISSSTAIRGINYIRVLPSTAYYAKGTLAVFYHDANKSFISYEMKTDTTFTTPSNCAYLRLCTSYLITYHTYNHDICINLSDPAKNGTYEPYKRVVLPLNLADLEVISPNIWDEEWEEGAYDTSGNKTAISNFIRNKNIIPCKPNTAYYFYDSEGDKIQTAFFYDSGGNFLGYTSAGIFNTTFSTPNGCEKMCFCRHTLDYTGNICINESNPGWNGHYYPHGTFNPFPDGLRSTDNDTYDEIIGTKVIRRIKKSVGSEFTLHNTSSANYKTYKTTLADGYNQSTPVQHWVDNFGINYNGVLNSESVSVETVQYDGGSGGIKTFYVSVAPGRNIDNFVLYYKLAIPEEFELATPLPLSTFSGTNERRLPEDTENDVMAPFECDMTYGTNNEQILDVINTKYTKPSGGIPKTDLAQAVQDQLVWRKGSNPNSPGVEFSSGNASGEAATADGFDTVAAGDASHAEGYATEASGDGAHAEGLSTSAIGDGSHAEGNMTIASGSSSHAEGIATETGGDATDFKSPAADVNEAIGAYAHAEGNSTIAKGANSHAEGKQTFASGKNSHAEGQGVIASGGCAHAEGYVSSAIGDISHAEGNLSFAVGYLSHAEGYCTIAKGSDTHIEGGNWRCQGYLTGDANATTYQMRLLNFDSSSISESEFISCFSGTPVIVGAHSRLITSISPQNYQNGEFTITVDRTISGSSISDQAFLLSFAVACGVSSHVEGQGGISLGQASHLEGNYCISRNIYEHGEGRYNLSHKASDTYGDSGNTQHSVGIGSAGDRKNAFEIMQNGDVYVKGLGGYDGTNAGASGVLTLQAILSGIETLLAQI